MDFLKFNYAGFLILATEDVVSTGIWGAVAKHGFLAICLGALAFHTASERDKDRAERKEERQNDMDERDKDRAERKEERQGLLDELRSKDELNRDLLQKVINCKE